MQKKVLIIDDSALMRRVLSDIINSDERFLVSKVATNGLDALNLLIQEKENFDAIILDINMPKMNGLEFMEELVRKKIKATVIIVSTVAIEGAKETIRALELGAFDFVTKPESFFEVKSNNFKNKIIECLVLATKLYHSSVQEICATIEQTKNLITNQQVNQVKNQVNQKQILSEDQISSQPNNQPVGKLSNQATGQPNNQPVGRLSSQATGQPNNQPVGKLSSQATGQPINQPNNQAINQTSSQSINQLKNLQLNRNQQLSQLNSISADENQTSNPMNQHTKDTFLNYVGKQKRLIVIACSTGGPKALQQVIPYLSKNLDCSILIVQHMPEGFTASLSRRLDELSNIHVKEAENGEVIVNGVAYIAKGGSQMRLIDTKTGSKQLSVTVEAARNGLKPCADILLESLVNSDYTEITCVVLTGMGSDGTLGIKQLKEKKNIYVIAQDEASSTVYGMPKVVKETGLVNEVLSLDKIASAINKRMGVL